MMEKRSVDKITGDIDTKERAIRHAKKSLKVLTNSTPAMKKGVEMQLKRLNTEKGALYKELNDAHGGRWKRFRRAFGFPASDDTSS